MIKEPTVKSYFSVVVPSGSTCCCRRQRHFSIECGHKHRTQEAAEACQERLLGYSNGSCSATWYNSRVVEFDRKNESEISYDCDGSQSNVIDQCTC